MASEREELRRLIEEWNKERWDMFALSEPDENLDFHGAMKFYFHDVGQKVTTKVIRVASTATARAVIDALVDKFHPDMRMLSRPEYSLWELHETGEERELQPAEKPLLVQLTWHKHKRDGRFLLHPKGLAPPPLPPLAFADRPLLSDPAQQPPAQPMHRKLSRREKKEAKKAARERGTREAEDAPSLASSLFSHVPPTTFTRTISNPEIVMKKRRERKLQQKLNNLGDGGSLKVFGGSLEPSRPYVTLLVGGRERADRLLAETLEKYGLESEDPGGFVLVERVVDESGRTLKESELSAEDCPLLLLANSPKPGATEFHVRRRRSGGAATAATESGPLLLELNPDGSEVTAAPPRRIRIESEVTEIGSDRSLATEPSGIQLFGPYIHPRHAVLTHMDGVVTITPVSPNAQVALNGQEIRQTATLGHNAILRIGQSHLFRFLHPNQSLHRRAASNPHLHQQQLARSASGRESPGLGDPRRFKPKPRPRASLRERKRSDSLPPPPTPSEEDPIAPPFPSDPPRPASILFKSKTLESLTRPLKKPVEEESALETTFDVDGSIDTKAHFGPLPVIGAPATPTTTRVTPLHTHQHSTLPREGPGTGVSGLGNGIPAARGVMGRSRDAIPAILELVEEAEEAFLSAVLRDIEAAGVGFKLAPAYAIYAALRYRISPHFRTSALPRERADRLKAFLGKAVSLLAVVVQDRCHSAQPLAFWMANSSELLNFIKMDADIGPGTIPEPQESLADVVEKSFAHLGACLKEELNAALPTFLDGASDDEAALRPTLLVLSSAMSLLRQSRVNAALTIQLFSQLFHYINCYLFNWLVSSEGGGWLSGSWGERLSARLGQVQAWSLKQGLELAAECHLDRLVQALHLLRTPKELSELAALGATCYKLNSLQVHHLLSRYVPAADEAPVHPELIHNVVAMARAHADELAASEGRAIMLEEEGDLGLPFLLPEDGYSPDLVKGIPAPLQHFIDFLLAKGICRMILQPSSSGSWTVHFQSPPLVSAQDAGAGAETVQITFPKGPEGGIGLSIVCAQGEKERATGIFVKKVVPGSAAERDGRLGPGDQLVAVNGESLLGVEQEEAARLMAASGATVSFEVRKQAALYNGLATWLHSNSSPQASPRLPDYRHSPGRPQRQASLSSLHSAQPSLPFQHRPPSVRSASEFAAVPPRSPGPIAQMNPGYGSPGSQRSSLRAQQWSQPYANGVMSRSGGASALSSAVATPTSPGPTKISLSMDANINNGHHHHQAPPPMAQPPPPSLAAAHLPPDGIFRAAPEPEPMGLPRVRAEPPRPRSPRPTEVVVPSLPPRQPSPAPDYPVAHAEPHPAPEPFRAEVNGSATSSAAEEKEAMEARMQEELIRMMEEEVARLEAKEFLSEAEQRRYRAIKYDLAYKRRLREETEEPPSPTEPTAAAVAAFRHSGGAERLHALEDEVERSLRLAATIPEAKSTPSPTPPPTAPPVAKKIPPAVPPKKKTVQFQPPPPASTSGSSTSPRSDPGSDATPPPTAPPQLQQQPEQPRRYVFQTTESETPRAQVIGGQEVYRDPRAQRLAANRQAASPTGPDASGLAFRDKMRLFAAQLGENTPKQGAKSSKAQREIEHTILTPQS